MEGLESRYLVVFRVTNYTYVVDGNIVTKNDCLLTPWWISRIISRFVAFGSDLNN